MPFVEDAEAGGPIRQTALPAEDRPGLGEIFGAAFRQGNTVGSALAGGPPPDPYAAPLPGFDPFEGLEERYRPHASAFGLVNSPAEAAALKARIDREEEDRRTLAAGGAWGLAAALSAGILDPLQFVPVAGAGGRALLLAREVSLARRAGAGALDTARAGAIGGAAAEAGLQAGQVTRTAEESVEAVGLGALLGGVLGAAAPAVRDAFLAARRARTGRAEAPEAAIAREIDPPAPGQPDPLEAGAIRVEAEPPAPPAEPAPAVPLSRPEPPPAPIETPSLVRRVETREGDPVDVEFPDALHARLYDHGKAVEAGAYPDGRSIEAEAEKLYRALKPWVFDDFSGPKDVEDLALDYVDMAAERQFDVTAPPGRPRAWLVVDAEEQARYLQGELQRAKASPGMAAGDLVAVDPDSIAVDAARFQFKAGGDAAGVTERLAGVKQWDRRLAGVALVWEDGEGRRFIVDGHQRLALAKRLKAEGQDARLNAVILREADGVSAEEARTIAALKNIAEGTGSPIDAAKVLRAIEADPALRAEADRLPPLPPSSALGRDGRALARLGPEAFGMVVNDVVRPEIAAVVGRRIDDLAEQVAALRVLAAAKPRSIGEAELLVRDIQAAGFTRESQQSLFGPEAFAGTLYGERAKVLQAALQRLAKDKAVFRTLVDEEGRITTAGNALDRAANSRRLTDDEKLLVALDRLAHVKGPVSDALDAAARQLKAGGKPGPLAGSFVDAVRLQLREGLDPVPGGGGTRPPGEGGGSAAAGNAGGGSAGGLEPPDLFSAGGGSLSAASVDEANLFERLKSSLGLDRAIAWTSPLLRLATSPSVKARQWVQELVETPFAYEKNGLGIATPIAVETEVKLAQAPLANAVRLTDAAFARYRARLAGGAEPRLSAGQFREAVGRAMRRGDRDAIPEVAEAAAAWRREVFDPLKDRAIAAELLPEDVGVETAVSYLSRVYNLDRLKAERPAFIRIATDWLEGQQTLKAGLQADLRALEDDRTFLLDQMDRVAAKIRRREASEAATAARADEAGRAQKGSVARAVELKDQMTGQEQRLAEIREQLRRLQGRRAARQRDVGGAPRDAEALAADRQAARADDEEFAALIEERRDLLGRGKALVERTRGKAAETDFHHRRQRIRRQELLDRLEGATASKAELERIRDDIGARLEDLGARIDEAVASWPGRSTTVRQILGRPTDLARAELIDEADKIADHILGHPGGRNPYEGYAGADPDRRGMLKARVFNIPDAAIEDFLESDVELIGRMYTRTMAPDVALAERFGSIGMERQIEDLRASYVPLIRAAATPAERTRLEGRRAADIRDLEALRDRIRGTYLAPSDPDSPWIRAGRVIRDINYLRLMGGMTLSAIPDMGRAVMVEGLQRVMGDGVGAMVRNFAAFRLAAAEARRAGTALDLVLDTRAQSIADIGDDFGRHSKFERGLQAATRKFGLVSLMAPWNAAMKHFAGVVVQSRILDAALAGEAAGPRAIERLAMSGIDTGMAQRIGEQFRRHGEIRDGVRLANTLAWDDQGAVRAFRAALVKDVDRIIVTPGAGDRPLWMSSETGKVIGQFKGFAFASAQRVALSGLQQRDAAALNGALLMTMLGMGVYAIRQGLRDDGKLSDNPAVWLAEGLDKAGLTGWLFDVNNILEKTTGLGVNRITGGAPMDRYASRNALGALLGPTAGLVQDGARVLSAAGGSVISDEARDDWTTTDSRALRRMLPLQNLFYLRWLIDQAEAGVNEAFGVRAPEKRRKAA